MSSKLPCIKLSEQFGVTARTIRKFAINAKNGVYNHGREGSEEALIAKIKDEAHKTFMRRYPNFINSDRRRKNFISYRSLKTYQKKCSGIFDDFVVNIFQNENMLNENIVIH